MPDPVFHCAACHRSFYARDIRNLKFLCPACLGPLVPDSPMEF